MTETITPASLRAHADWWVKAYPVADTFRMVPDALRREADRLEAESAREDRLAGLERIYRSVDSPLVRDGLAAVLSDLQRDAEWLIAEAVHQERTQLAADGRLLPEGGVVKALCGSSHSMRRDITCTRIAGHDGDHDYQFGNGEGIFWPSVTPPAVPAPGSGPDGTPERPWPTWQEVPEGVRYWQGDGRPNPCLAYWVNQGGVRMHGDAALHEPIPSVTGDINDLAPFVRVDGGKA